MSHRHLFSTLTVLTLITVIFAPACNNASQDFTTLTAANPVAQIAEGLTLSINPGLIQTEFKVKLSAIPAADFTGGQAGDQWEKARAALPAHLTLQSAVFAIQTAGALPEQIFLSVLTPAEAANRLLELYAWDGRQWTFLPAKQKSGQLTATVTQPPRALGLFETPTTPPAAFITIEPGQAIPTDAAGVVDGVLLGGVMVQIDGSLIGQLPGVPVSQAYATYPVIRNYSAKSLNIDFLNNLFNNPGLRANHLQAVTAFAVSQPYTGVAIDYRGIPAELNATYASFIADLAAQLRAQNKQLLVVVPPPVTTAATATTAGYDWRALGNTADAVLLTIDDPTAYGNGTAEAMLTFATGEISRSRLYLMTSALSVDSANGVFTRLAPTAAFAPFGSVAAAVAGAAQPGQPVTVTLSGNAQSLDYDAAAFAARYTYTDAAGVAHTVWVMTAETLRQQTSLAEKYHLRGIVVNDLGAADLPAGLVNAVSQYKTAAAAAAPPAVSLVWTVADAAGVVAQTTAQPNQPFVYIAQAAGDYQISAEVQNGSAVKLGSAQVSYAAAPTPTALAVAYTGDTNTSVEDNTTSQTDNTNTFVPPAPVVSGGFELGGQVPGYIGHPGEMQQAGMKWVKLQATGGDVGGNIASAHAAGFKVIISAVGDKGQASNSGYWPQYASWVAGIAAQGADAIEVWNEANIEREWPNPNPALYTELLKQAYTAIKGANSGTMVVSGAPAPTGVNIPGAVVSDDNFLREMANAGAANYMDCVGIHFNSGTTSPSATSGAALSGYHYSYYFWPMINLYYDSFAGSRQLCFTELGYASPEGYGFVPANFNWASGITVAQQAQWLAESASLAASSGQVRLMIIFNVDFTVYLDNDPQAAYAMIRKDGSCPACAALDAVMP